MLSEDLCVICRSVGYRIYVSLWIRFVFLPYNADRYTVVHNSSVRLLPRPVFECVLAPFVPLYFLHLQIADLLMLVGSHNETLRRGTEEMEWIASHERDCRPGCRTQDAHVIGHHYLDPCHLI